MEPGTGTALGTDADQGTAVAVQGAAEDVEDAAVRAGVVDVVGGAAWARDSAGVVDAEGRADEAGAEVLVGGAA